MQPLAVRLSIGLKTLLSLCKISTIGSCSWLVSLLLAATAPNGELWVSDSENGKVAFYKPNSVDRLGDLATGAGAHAIVFSDDNQTGYISNQIANTVTVIDIKSHKVKTNIAVGKKPNGLVWRAK